MSDAGRLVQLAESLSNRLDVRVARELFEHGEWLVGLEILADNAYEDDVALSGREMELLGAALRGSGSDAERRRPDVRKCVETLCAAGPRGTDGRYRCRILMVRMAGVSGFSIQGLLVDALSLPANYDGTWAGFSNCIADGESLPHRLILVGWETLVERFPGDAFQLLSRLRGAIRTHYHDAVEVVLVDSDWNEVSSPAEEARLRALIA